ncbi:MAG: general secretion pathway protein GspN [Luteimonas sp.]|nr:general secretion pathway protein GspN [Luteimonas sp.]
MRADTANAKTWLLGAAATWALCTWLLAMLGMGGSVMSLPEDPALLQPLPQAGKPSPERLGPLPQYAEIGRRPLFSEDRRPQPFVINPDGEDDTRNDFNFILTSVLIAPDFRMAILQPGEGGDSVRVRVGSAPESARGWRLVSLEPRKAVFEGPDGERKLDLRVFDGEGGAPPTPMSVADADPAQPAADLPPPPDDPGMGTVKPVAETRAPAGTQRPGMPPAKAGQPDNRASSDQIDAIRKRIEARRAKLRQDEMKSSTPGNKP